MGSSMRREILQSFGCVAASGARASIGVRSAFAEGRGIDPGLKFGVQLNAFPNDPKHFQSFTDALTQVKQIGYQGFESGFRNVSEQFAAPQRARRRIKASGLAFFGVHVFLPTEMYGPSTRIAPLAIYQPVARGGPALGAKHLILSGAPAADADQLKQKIAALNTAGTFAKSVGITAAYHNHSPEFESKIGEIEALCTKTDPALVSFVLDAGHAYRGGADVPAFPLAKVAATEKQIHWKGWIENEEEREDLSKTGAQVIAPAYKAMKEAFSA